MSLPTFALMGEPLAVDLVNTVVAERGTVRDLLAEPSDLASWLVVERDRLGPRVGDLLQIDEEVLARFRELRQALTELFGAAVEHRTPPGEALAIVNRASMAGPRLLELRWEAGGEPLAHESSTGSDGVAGAVAAVARSGIELLGGPGRTHLRHCGNQGCVLWFVSGGRPRQWCSAACGNRARVARHYYRHTTGRGS